EGAADRRILHRPAAADPAAGGAARGGLAVSADPGMLRRMGTAKTARGEGRGGGEEQTPVSSPPIPHPSLAPGGRLALALVTLALFTDMAVYDLVVPFLPDYARLRGLSAAGVGLLFGA